MARPRGKGKVGWQGPSLPGAAHGVGAATLLPRRNPPPTSVALLPPSCCKHGSEPLGPPSTPGTIAGTPRTASARWSRAVHGRCGHTPARARSPPDAPLVRRGCPACAARHRQPNSPKRDSSPLFTPPPMPMPDFSIRSRCSSVISESSSFAMLKAACLAMRSFRGMADDLFGRPLWRAPRDLRRKNGGKGA